MKLTQNQRTRYKRQMMLPEVGSSGQLKLEKSKVLIIGCGGLGSVNALYLAAAGVGKIGIADGDRVELSNLNRQIIHFTEDIGKRKTESAVNKLNLLNSDVEIITYPVRVDLKNISKLIREYDFIIDCTDNIPARYMINDACIKAGKPFSHAGVCRFKGQTMTVIPEKGPCYRCVFPEPPGELAVNGILGTVAGLLGIIQATEAIKYIIGEGKLLAGKLLTYDALEMKFREIPIYRDRNCKTCGKK